MIKRNFQNDINGRLSELIKNDKSRAMNKVDYNEYPGTGPFESRKGLIYKINLPEGFITIILSAKSNDPETPIVRLDIRHHETILQREFNEGSYNDNYQLAYIIYREVCNKIDSSKSVVGIDNEFDLTIIP